MKIKIAFSAIFLLIVNSTFGQWYKKITNAVGSVANATTKVVTAPVQSLVNTGQVLVGNANVNNIYKPYQDAAKATGTAIPNTMIVVTDPQNYMTQQARSFASLAGKPGEFIFDVGTFSNNYYTQLTNSGAQGIGNILQGQNPFQLSAAPLAAAIRAAHEKYSASSQPIPKDVKNALSGHFSPDVLNSARYAIGDIEITLPNFIGKGQKFFGNDDYAVTVDNIIVFNSTPGDYSTNAHHWAHEITHIQQYKRLGIEAFAFDYIKDLGRSLENDAISNANRITNKKYNITSSYLKAVSFDMSGTSSDVNYQQNPEYYVSQCIFPQDQFGAMYLVTNYGRIIAVNPFNGDWYHIGYATPPLMPNVAWSYTLPSSNWRYAVGADGRIYNPLDPIYNQFGQVVNYANWNPIGYVVKLQ